MFARVVSVEIQEMKTIEVRWGWGGLHQEYLRIAVQLGRSSICVAILGLVASLTKSKRDPDHSPKALTARGKNFGGGSLARLCSYTCIASFMRWE